MRALVLTRHGGPEVLRVQERPDPPVGPGEVRVAVRAAGISFADVMARIGLYPDAPKPPCVLGYEIAGVVESVGEGVDAPGVGDRVLGGTRFNGFAELVVTPAEDMYPLPEQVSFEEGAAFPVNYATAYAALVVMAGLDAGERVLIHAAGGGVGTAATQIAKWRGAEVFGTASAWKHDAIRAQGVDHPIDYRTTDFAQEVRRITGGEGVDVVLDVLGPVSFKRSYRLLRPGGRLIMAGGSEMRTGDKRSLRAALPGLLRVPFATMPWWKSFGMLNENKGVFGLQILHWWSQEGSLDRIVKPILAGLESGQLSPVVGDVFPLDRAADAHRLIEDRKNIGKVVLVP